MSLYRTFFYVISENQLVKDQRNFKNIVKKISSVFKYITPLFTQLSHAVCGLCLNSCL